MVSDRIPTTQVMNPIIINVAARIRDWICPEEWSEINTIRNRIPRITPIVNGIAPRIVKNASGLYIT